MQILQQLILYSTDSLKILSYNNSKHGPTKTGSFDDCIQSARWWRVDEWTTLLRLTAEIWTKPGSQTQQLLHNRTDQTETSRGAARVQNLDLTEILWTFREPRGNLYKLKQCQKEEGTRISSYFQWFWFPQSCRLRST